MWVGAGRERLWVVLFSVYILVVREMGFNHRGVHMVIQVTFCFGVRMGLGREEVGGTVLLHNDSGKRSGRGFGSGFI